MKKGRVMQKDRKKQSPWLAAIPAEKAVETDNPNTEEAASWSSVAIQLAPATPGKEVKEGTCTVHCCAPGTAVEPLTPKKPLTPPPQPVTPLPLTSKPLLYYVRRRKRSKSTDEHTDNSTANGAKKKLDFVSYKCSALLGFGWVTKKRSKRSIRSNKWALSLIATEQDQNTNQEIVPYTQYALASYGGTTIVPHAGNNDENKIKRTRAKVDLDLKTIRIWKILMGKLPTDAEGSNLDGEEQWEEQRLQFRGRADVFISRMRLIQGDRQFSPWKGSVLDSVIGVFLTQNVSDHLSSSAFMALASKFPLRPREESDHYTCKMSTLTQSFGSITSSSMPNQENQVPSYFIYHNRGAEQNKMDKADELVTIDKTKDDPESIGCEDVNVQRRGLETPDGTMGVSTKTTANSESEEKRSLDGALSASNGASRANRTKSEPVKTKDFDWDSLRKEAYSDGCMPERSKDSMDSLDWEALRNSDVKEISETIKERGMNNVLAGRIKDLLDRLDKDHGSLDLEWLRNVPPEKAKEFLLSIRGLGLKSAECVRLLTLHQHAFPVDTNVGRICVRLGWVPLQPLPDSLQLHLLESYPILESIQKYLWPRLCTLDQRTLYELHYHMITFGKVFCTKRKPNCNACPMRGECKHFASAWTSSRLLQGPEETRLMKSRLPIASENHDMNFNLCLTDESYFMEAIKHNKEPIIEEPPSPEPDGPFESVIEEAFCEDFSEIPTIDLNLEDFTRDLQKYEKENMELQVGDIEKAIVAITREAASIPVPKLKNLTRLRTEHQVYELPDGHPLLEGLEPREDDDPCSYLLSIWTAGETANSTEPPQTCCNFQETGKICEEMACFACCCRREELTQTIRGTLLIPCRTANRGRFPLNGTYFQVNEVFADHQSSYNPLVIPRRLIWNLPRRIVYFGTSIPTIFRGLSIEEIQLCFSRGFVCLRGFDRETRAPKPLSRRLHQAASHAPKRKKDENKAKPEIPIKRYHVELHTEEPFR